MAPILAYWGIRGLAQPIRLLLAYTGTEFEDKHYVCGPPPDYDKSSWLDVKFSLGLDFPNLPYYIDGDVKLTQSNAILRYIARKHNMCGETEKEKIRVDMMENEAMDFRNGFVTLCYRTFDTEKDNYIANLPTILGRLSKFLGNRNWFAGDKITFVDFVIYELLDQHKHLVPDCLKDFPNLMDFVTRFEDLEPIKAYMASPKFKKAPLNGLMAKFGNQ